MGYWDSTKQEIIRFPDRDLGNGWIEKDCGCCNGLEWGGYEPRECDRCKGRGFYIANVISSIFYTLQVGGIKKKCTNYWCTFLFWEFFE